jgi:hypothetical protein
MIKAVKGDIYLINLQYNKKRSNCYGGKMNCYKTEKQRLVFIE